MTEWKHALGGNVHKETLMYAQDSWELLYLVMVVVLGW